MRLSGKAAAICIAAVMSAMPRPAAAQQRVLTFLAGGAAGLALHESGHVALDLAMGVPPGLKKVTFGPLPFFAITHDPVSPVREFAISSAGFWMQEGLNEILLKGSRGAPLRDRNAPFRKGMVAFNVLASVAYAAGAFASVGPPERDPRGIASSANISERAIGGVILAPAVLDAMRYYRPDNPWIRWASRAVKIGGAMLILKAR
jgi:hypothetical protein